LDPDVALGIAVKTLMDEINLNDTPQLRAQKRAEFPGKFVPFATHLEEDMSIAFGLFDALAVGIKSLDKEISAADKAMWEKAGRYLELRR
jgi:hypothetical protein